MSVGFNPCPVPYLPHRVPMGGDPAAVLGLECCWERLPAGEKNTDIRSAGKISESQLAELPKIVLIYSPESLSKAEQHLRGNNCTKV